MDKCPQGGVVGARHGGRAADRAAKPSHGRPRTVKIVMGAMVAAGPMAAIMHTSSCRSAAAARPNDVSIPPGRYRTAMQRPFASDAAASGSILIADGSSPCLRRGSPPRR